MRKLKASFLLSLILFPFCMLTIVPPAKAECGQAKVSRINTKSYLTILKVKKKIE